MTPKRATSTALATLLLSVATTVGAVNTSLPPRFSDLIRDDRVSDARALIERELAQLPATASALQRCEALHHQMLVIAFEFGTVDQRIERANAAAACWRAVPGERAEALALLWPLREATNAIRSGQVKPGIEATDALRPAFERLAAALPPMERALGLDALATADYWSSRYEAAVRNYRAAVDMLESGGTIEKVYQAELFSQLAEALERNGETGEALIAAQHALDLVSPPFRGPQMDRIRILSILGSIEFQAERWDAALLHADTAIALLRPLGRAGQMLLNYNLVRRSNALSSSGRISDAVAPMQEAIAQERASTRVNAPRLASRLGNLAELQMDNGQFDAAEASLAESLRLFRDALGADSGRLLGSEISLARLALYRGRYADANSRVGELIERAEKQFGDDAERLVELLRLRGQIAFAMGNFLEADASLRRALAMLPSKPGVLAPERLRLTREIARSQHALGHDDEALALAIAAERQRQSLLHDFGSHLGGAHAVALQREMAGTLDMVLALTVARPSPERIREAWALQIGARQPIATLIKARFRAARASSDSDTRRLWQTYENASEQYASAAISANVDEALTAQRREAMDVAERALAGKVAAVASVRADATLELDQLKKLLPAETALTAYVLVEDDPWQMRLVGDARRTGRYYAFTLSAEQAPRLVDLGTAAAVDAAALSWQRKLRDPKSLTSDWKAAGVALRKLVFDPLLLPSSKHWMAIPAGTLYRVSWLPLPLAGGAMIDTGPLPHLLDSERDLRQLMASNPSSAVGLVLVGAPKMTVRDAACPGGGALPGALDEINALGALWREARPDAKTQLLTGEAAEEGAVRIAMQTGQALHFATHTVAAAGACPQLLASRSVQLVHADAVDAAPNTEAGALLLSAPRPAVGKHTGAEHDGMLTATEVATLDLSRVQNVVLSACDTGSGVVTPEEGAFGLRRAFRLAGARAVVMSLWPVDDAATSMQMQAYYQRRLRLHEDVPAALAGAARATIIARRAQNKSTHPYYWAAFVASGDWR